PISETTKTWPPWPPTRPDVPAWRAIIQRISLPDLACPQRRGAMRRPQMTTSGRPCRPAAGRASGRAGNAANLVVQSFRPLRESRRNNLGRTLGERRGIHLMHRHTLGLQLFQRLLIAGIDQLAQVLGHVLAGAGQNLLLLRCQ